MGEKLPESPLDFWGHYLIMFTFSPYCDQEQEFLGKAFLIDPWNKAIKKNIAFSFVSFTVST
jgi:hypothetical protein